MKVLSKAAACGAAVAPRVYAVTQGSGAINRPLVSLVVRLCPLMVAKFEPLKKGKMNNDMNSLNKVSRRGVDSHVENVRS